MATKFVVLAALALLVVSNTRAIYFTTSQSVQAPESPAPATGPLKPSHHNPRYFVDANDRVIHLTGSHNWANLVDLTEENGRRHGLEYSVYLDLLQRYGHNFIRLWAWESPAWIFKRVEPYRYLRTGPGIAHDGDPKFDLTRFNPEYFDRLRNRVIAAGKRGIYVSIMLFVGSGVDASDWRNHPFNVANNINGIDGDANQNGDGEEIFTGAVSSVTKLQEEYVRKVIDTVNDLDNVLYEIGNELVSTSLHWQYEMIQTIRNYQAGKPKQHPVGMTSVIVRTSRGDNHGDLAGLLRSPADWISPGWNAGEWQRDPQPTDGTKVIILDTDHLWGDQPGASGQWVWKAFLRGHNPIYMDTLESPSRPAADESTRVAMGQTLTYARKVDLRNMTPQGQLVSSGYCLANPGVEYLAYVEARRRQRIPLIGTAFTNTLTIDLGSAQAEFEGEWFSPATGKIMSQHVLSTGHRQDLAVPFSTNAVVHLRRRSPPRTEGAVTDLTALVKASPAP